MAQPHLTERQQKWFATVRANLEKDTGRSMEQWVAIARTCPETRHKARLAWLKANYGLMQNRASQVLNEAFGSTMAWSEPDKLIEVLWADTGSREIFAAVQAMAKALPEVIVGPRKGYTGFSRKVQFAAMRPAKGGGAVLGLAVPPDSSSKVVARGKSESWAERLAASAILTSATEVDDDLKALLRQAWERA